MAFTYLLPTLLLVLPIEGILNKNNPDDLFAMVTNQSDTFRRLEASLKMMEEIIVKQNKTINDIQTTVLLQNNTTEIPALNNQKSGNQIGFYAQLSADRGNLGDARAIEFDKVITNEGNAYDHYHGHFTAPVNGMYQMSASMMGVSNNDLACEIVKNGVPFAYLYGGAGNYIANTQTSVILLNAGDMVWVRHTAGQYDDRIHALYSYFSGFLIKQT